MSRHTWVLLGWSPQHGLACSPVGVLGIDESELFVEWIPREHAAGRVWRERLGGSSPAEVAKRIAGWAETPVAPAASVEPLGGVLADAVRAQVDDVLGSAR
ncbi:hypothetical protein [Amycolatopsis sp. NPDC051061]|uniref:hypothetical protein n=1 Tax=Amycolatopsis sp. NPDC051061 TaxID=3155042 RepID=UPI00344A0CA0